MDTIDVHDLPEEDAQLLIAFVDFLRQRRHQSERKVKGLQPIGKGREKGASQETQPSSFAVWSLEVAGALSREEMYDHL